MVYWSNSTSIFIRNQAIFNRRVLASFQVVVFLYNGRHATLEPTLKRRPMNQCKNTPDVCLAISEGILYKGRGDAELHESDNRADVAYKCTVVSTSCMSNQCKLTESSPLRPHPSHLFMMLSCITHSSHDAVPAVPATSGRGFSCTTSIGHTRQTFLLSRHPFSPRESVDSLFPPSFRSLGGRPNPYYILI